MKKPTKPSKGSSQNELAKLRARLEEAEQTLDAIRSGHVDALIVSGPDGDRIFTLEEPEHRYRRLVETMKEGAGILARDGTLLYCNRQLAEMLHVPLEQLIGAEANRHVAPVSRKTFDALMREAEGGAAKAEIAFRLALDGAVVPAYVSMSATGDVDGSLCLVATDLSEQKRSEEIVAAERLATSILDQAAEAVVVCDPDGRVVRASQSAHRICARNPLLAPFSQAFPLEPPDGRGRVPDIVGAALRGVISNGTDATLRRGAGDYLHLLASAAPLHNAQKEIVGCVVSLVDITQRKRAENAVGLLSRAGAALVASLDLEDMLQRLTREIVPGFADCCSVYLMPEGGGEKLELAAVRHVDREIESRIAEEAKRDPAGPLPIHTRVFETGRSELLREVTERDLLPVVGGEAELARVRPIVPRSAAAAPLRAQRRVFGAIVVGRSRSARLFAADDLATLDELALRVAVAIDNSRLLDLARREQARVEEANRAKDEFLAAVSHELRTPLNAILGWTRMLRSGRLDADKRERALETVERNAIIQKQLIEDLLDITRIVTGKLRLHVRQLEVKTVVLAAADSVRPVAEAKGVALSTEVAEDVPGVLGDADRLQQVIWNLLSNAVKFTPRGGSVSVSARGVVGCVEIRVRDDGEGIAEAFLPHVFDRFQQAHGGSTRQHGGLGIGLTIAKNLVEAHGGRISASSDGEGRGSTFVISLPAAAADSAAAVKQEDSPCENGDDLTGLRILVVDDDDDGRELVASILGECGATVTTASSAKEAFDKLRAAPFNLLVSDIGMPGEDGYSLVSRVRTLPESEGGRVPAVALTAFARGEDRARAMRSGFDMHLPKPVDAKELVAALATLTGRRS